MTGDRKNFAHPPLGAAPNTVDVEILRVRLGDLIQYADDRFVIWLNGLLVAALADRPQRGRN